MQPRPRGFVALDGLRGIAALSIVVAHANYFFPRLPVAYLAVDFFFVLSGFVLAHAYAKRLQEGLSGGRFMLARLIRLYPLYLLGSALMLPLLWHGYRSGTVDGRYLAVSVATAAFFVPSPLSFTLYPLDEPAWSLLFELLANAVFGFGMRRITLGTLAVFVACAGAALVAAFSWGPVNAGFFWTSFPGGVVRVGYSFFAGVLVYLRHGALIRLSTAVIVVLLLAALAARPGRYEAAFAAVCSLAFFPLLVWMGAGVAPGRIFGPACSFLGRASYAVYVLHWPLLTTLLRLHPPPTALAGIAFIAAIVALAAVADRLFDAPCRAWLASMVPASTAERPHPARAM
jgi:peptidoglycan/LPS O-acetylase OafA/YrhL